MSEGFATASLDGGASAGPTPLSGQAPRVGSFRFLFDDDRWEWSPEVAEMHGYPPEAMSPSTDRVLAHKHRDDQQAVATTLARIRRDRAPLSTRHRIVDTRGRVHHVVIVGDELRDDAGTLIGTHGFYVDLSPMVLGEEERITEKVAEISSRRAAIEQAKGALTVIYGIAPEAAFEILRWRSQQTNTTLRALAVQLVADFQSLDAENGPPSRAVCDRLVMTVHERTPR
ncbi:PAS and ANTAR domain-containing protein [Mycolicibacterium arenosum]|uniref:PAS and ANTAR domain-containing protein n=1 Tax=Mycolicibacterium arenosum TaxID=2952157 RepID=A0ABT1MF34_9MYCO|nr:PAS and ANTAR domain-containing protein [Mycolicibacterium sp. CAU 1645]MCP9276824.1 PAS and ANTAR domain-containing protein [Mycolicibacterium sp. CAU 1645]